MGRRPNPVRYFLRTEEVLELLERRRVLHGDVATRLGISRSYWSRLVHRHKPLTESMRGRILACRVFRGLAGPDLWERVERGEP